MFRTCHHSYHTLGGTGAAPAWLKLMAAAQNLLEEARDLGVTKSSGSITCINADSEGPPRVQCLLYAISVTLLYCPEALRQRNVPKSTLRAHIPTGDFLFIKQVLWQKTRAYVSTKR